MLKNVDADTVGKLTAESAFLCKPSEISPTAEEMIVRIRAELASREEDLKKFNDLVDNMPKGFRLVPVLYTKVDSKQNAEVMTEFSGRVRRLFLQHLANTYEAELDALGIPPHGIEQMKKGNNPDDGNDALYAIDVDHLVERSGGGRMSMEKEVDPMMPAGSTPTFRINHFSNLFLLPEQIHGVKNWMNDLQGIHKMGTGESKWVLMMIPEAAPDRSGFITPRQEPDHPLHGLHPLNASAQHNYAYYMAKVTHDTIRELWNDPDVGSVLKSIGEMAAGKNKTVVELMREEESSPASPERSLSNIFNSAVFGNPALQNNLPWHVIEATDRWLKITFNTAKKDAKEMTHFKRTYRKLEELGLPKQIVNLPLKEAAALHETLEEIRNALLSAEVVKLNRKGLIFSEPPTKRKGLTLS
ncbi:MAG: hypothetical protein V1721_06695 [Pseudomonadota bacterium]